MQGRSAFLRSTEPNPTPRATGRRPQSRNKRIEQQIVNKNKKSKHTRDKSCNEQLGRPERLRSRALTNGCGGMTSCEQDQQSNERFQELNRTKCDTTSECRRSHARGEMVVSNYAAE